MRSMRLDSNLESRRPIADPLQHSGGHSPVECRQHLSPVLCSRQTFFSWCICYAERDQKTSQFFRLE
ncbi:hypothetical protein GE061_007980 [Apolygus lucorum]|uniref:Uncharacterized protein n=1 Tax=Apolygus lucorum TaxID=248454 RepID=A0A8S9WNG8_APOLU|nr:hypothetical protein GE061_007980 [Apolygus lucorum]